MRRPSPRLVFAATAAAVLSIFSAQADAPVYVRVALVMGNAAYVSAPPLANPGNDAKAMGQTLRAQGFNVIEVVNGSKSQMQSGIAKIRDTLRGQAGIGMLYYAGHGLQLNDHNFMVPVDAKLNKANDIPKETVDVSEAIAAFKTAGNRMNIIVLDACRDNPFGKSSQLKGLAPIDAPVGTFLAYATAPGNVAEDGDEKSTNGLYTSFLLQEMKRPNARIEDVFKRVRYQVRQKSDGRQVPWESTSLEEDFVFSDGQIVPPSKLTFETAKTAYETEISEWKSIGQSRNVKDFYSFIQKFPNGPLAHAAQGKIDELAKTSLVVQGAGADGKNMPLSLLPYRQGQNWTTIMTTTMSQFNSTIKTTVKYRVTECDASGCNLEIRYPETPGLVMIQRYNQTGGVIGSTIDLGNGQVTRQEIDPPMYSIPPGLLQVGQRWKGARTSSISGNTNTSTIVQIDGRIIGREAVTVTAGTFDTFKIEIGENTKTTQGIFGPETEMLIQSSAWHDPAIPAAIKSVSKTPTSTITVELVQYAER
jgi:hypothetical protein